MVAEEVVAVLELLEGLDVWLDGGWGVDALLGEQTRAHDDLDLVVRLDDVPRICELAETRGYELLGGGPPLSFELVDPDGHQLDVHPVVFDEHGDGLYEMVGGKTWPYPARGFAGGGSVLGRPVRCLTPEVQVLCHAGYELDAQDLHDLRLLEQRLGCRFPAP